MCVLFELVKNYRKYFHFYFLNMDISVTINDSELKFSVCNPYIRGEGRVSQNFDLGLSSYFM